LSAAGKLSGDEARELARDPRPEVRRAIARARRLPSRTRRELRRDGDPLTARLARAAGEQDTWNWRIMVGTVIPIAALLVLILQNVHSH
jgi:hypothetical protein